VPIAAFTTLVCEDDQKIRLLIRLTLEAEGSHVVEAGDGMSAIALAGSVKPDLVLIDMSLPDCDGAYVVRSLKALPELEQVPILLTVDRVSADDLAETEEAGITGFLLKPFDVSELVGEVTRLLERRRSGDEGLLIRRL
jgi:DNA-binding response OmpR family regulator